MNGKDAIDSPDETKLSELGIVSGDMIYILGGPADEVPKENLPAPVSQTAESSSSQEKSNPPDTEAVASTSTVPDGQPSEESNLIQSAGTDNGQNAEVSGRLSWKCNPTFYVAKLCMYVSM